MSQDEDITNEEYLHRQRETFDFLVPLMFPFFFDKETIEISDAMFYISIKDHIPREIKAHMNSLYISSLYGYLDVYYPSWSVVVLSKVHTYHPLWLRHKQLKENYFSAQNNVEETGIRPITPPQRD